MFAHLKIEKFTSNTDFRLEVMSRVFGLGSVERNYSWVAKINGIDEKFGFKREFLRPKTDYTLSNSKGSRGIYLNFFLEYGNIYDVSCRESWKSVDRYFLEITKDGEKKRIEKEVVIARFEDASREECVSSGCGAN